MKELHSLPTHYFISPAVEKLGSSKWKEGKRTISIVATIDTYEGIEQFKKTQFRFYVVLD